MATDGELKFMWFLTPSADDEEFAQAWRAAGERWTPPAGVRRWVRSRRTEGPDPFLAAMAARSAIAAVEELWVDAAAAELVRAELEDRADGLAGALASVVDLDASPLALTRENVVIDGDPPLGRGIRQMNLYRRREGMSREASHEHWRTTHAALVREAPGIGGYVQCAVVDEAADFDGVPITSFPDQAANDVFTASDSFAEQFQVDAPKFADVSYIRGVSLGEQIEVVPRSTSS